MAYSRKYSGSICASVSSTWVIALGARSIAATDVSRQALVERCLPPELAVPALDVQRAAGRDFPRPLSGLSPRVEHATGSVRVRLRHSPTPFLALHHVAFPFSWTFGGPKLFVRQDKGDFASRQGHIWRVLPIHCTRPQGP